MASFTSPFPFPALLNSMRSHEAIPKHPHTPAARLHFPGFPSLCFISRGSTVKARSQREQPGAKYLFHINQASVTLLNDCFFVQRLKGSRARPTQIMGGGGGAPLQSKDSLTCWQQECTLIRIPKSERSVCQSGQPCLGKLISLPLPPLPSVLGQQPTSSSHLPFIQPQN